MFAVENIVVKRLVEYRRWPIQSHIVKDCMSIMKIDFVSRIIELNQSCKKVMKYKIKSAILKGVSFSKKKGY